MATPHKKIVVVGEGDCGKTCLLSAFAEDELPEVYVPTVFGNFVYDITVDGKQVELALWDTAGQEGYDRYRPLSYPDADVVLICFPMDKPASMEDIFKIWVPEVKYHCPTVPILLVGTKKDLSVVNPKLVRDAAKSIGAWNYLECSAKTREGVREVFENAARASLGFRWEKKGKGKIICIIITCGHIIRTHRLDIFDFSVCVGLQS